MQIYEEINPCDNAVDLVANSSGVAWHEERSEGRGGGEITSRLRRSSSCQFIADCWARPAKQQLRF